MQTPLLSFLRLPFLIFVSTFLGIALFFFFLAFPRIQKISSSSTSQTPQEFTLIAPNEGGNGAMGTNEIYLIDAAGETVHTWTLPTSETQFAKLHSDGTLIVLLGSSSRPDLRQQTGSAARIAAFTWDGTLLWEYHDPLLHHDFSLLPNGNIAALAREYVPESAAWIDRILEINPITQEIVWTWSEQEGFDLSRFATHETNEIFHTNALFFIPEHNIFSENSCFLVSSRDQNLLFVVDQRTREVVWELQGDPLEKQHDPSLLTNGNILVFNNRPNKKASQILEIAPFTQDIVWSYEAAGFFASKVSGAQRLTSGNTLITEGTSGEVFEVTPDGDVVWTYTAYRSGTTEPMSLFRAERYSSTDIIFPFLP